MKYFLIRTAEGNRKPYGINRNHAINTRLLTKEGIDRMPRWNIVEMALPEEGFLPDIICSPFLLLAETCFRVAAMYRPDIAYKAIKLWDRQSMVNRTYFLTIIDEKDCISGRTQYNRIGNRITKLVLDKSRIGDQVLFRIKDFDSSCVVGRLDFVESILRRDAEGFVLEEVEVYDDTGG